MIGLAPLRWEDGADLIEANRQSAELHHPWVRPCIDRDGFAAWFRRTQTGALTALVARESASDAIAGIVTLSGITGEPFQSAYVGYYGNRATARRGLMTQALARACDWGFTALGLHRLEANIQPDNAASLALVRRAGFRKEGFSPRYLFVAGAWRDHERWALLADQALDQSSDRGLR